MSIEDKFHKLIQEHGQEERNAILEDIYAQMPELAPKSKPVKKRMSLRQKLCISMPIVAVGVCAAIVLPCVLVGNKPNNEITDPTFNYVSADDYSVSAATSIKEYGAQNNISFEYFDWYAFADYDTANVYTKKSNNEFLAISETLFNTQTDEEVGLFICDNKNIIDYLKPNIENCVHTKIINSSNVKWGAINYNVCGIFETNNYKYFVTIYGSDDENRLFELVSELLN